jgi:small redox-active disulfide protein 2
MLDVKVLGSGCPNCKRLEAEARAALDEMGVPYVISKVTEYDQIAAYGVLSTPALVINEKVVSAGRVLGKVRIIELARQFETA